MIENIILGLEDVIKIELGMLSMLYVILISKYEIVLKVKR